MLNMIAKRLGLLVFVIFGVTLVTFFMSRVIPGDPASMIAGQRASEETLQSIRQQLGLDQPIWTQYFNYVGDLLQGDLGNSIRTQRPVVDDLLQFFPATLELAIAAFILAILIGIPLGVLAALKKNTFWDHVSRVFSISGVSIPVFFSGLIAILVFYGILGWLPSNGRIGTNVNPPSNITGFYIIDSILTLDIIALKSSLKHLLLPAIVLSFAQLAVITRQVRASMLEVMSQEYIRTAVANGIKGRLLIISYALRNALIPTVTVIGVAFGSLLGGAIVTETIFGWPGMGKFVVESIQFLDFPAIMGFTIFIGIGYMVINLIVDIIYLFLNPQLKQ